MTKQPPAVPLPGPNVTPEPNEKIKGLAGNCSRHTSQATRHPSNQENTLARRNSLLPSLCRQTPLLNGIKKSRFWQEFHCWGTELHCSRHRNLCTEHQRHFELGSRQAIPLLQGHRNLCTEHQKHFGVGFLDKEAVAHLMATIDTTEHTISGRAPPCCTTGSADYYCRAN